MHGFFVHSRVIAAEALLAIGREEIEDRERYLSGAISALGDLGTEDILDNPDRVWPRALAVRGEIAFLRRDYRGARITLRRAMEELDRDPPLAWSFSHHTKMMRVSPVNSTDKHWFRPWGRNWTRAAELSLIVELEGRPDSESGFAQLQRYRTLSHSSTIAELSGFVSETALGAERRELLEKHRNDSLQLKARASGLGQEQKEIDEAISVILALSSKSGRKRRELRKLRQQKEELEQELEHNFETLRQVNVEIECYETEVVEIRGYLSRPNGIQKPDMNELRRTLAEEDAAVVELVRVKGTPWGQPIRWHAFTVTPDEGVSRVELPAKELDRELARIRSDRKRIRQSSLGKLSDLIVGKLPNHVFAYSNLFIAADGDAWAVPFRSLVRRRWWFVPWKLTDPATYSGWPIPEFAKKFMDSLATRMDSGVVTNVISTSHLVRLLQRSSIRTAHEDSGVVVGSSGNSDERILCQGLATSLEAHPAREPRRPAVEEISREPPAMHPTRR